MLEKEHCDWSGHLSCIVGCALWLRLVLVLGLEPLLEDVGVGDELIAVVDAGAFEVGVVSFDAED